MQIHKREQITQQANYDLTKSLLHITEEHDLTEGEYLQLIGDVFGGALTSQAKYQIRMERHGNENKPGGLA